MFGMPEWFRIECPTRLEITYKWQQMNFIHNRTPAVATPDRALHMRTRLTQRVGGYQALLERQLLHFPPRPPTGNRISKATFHGSHVP